MKKYLKNNEGMALAAVLVVMTITMLFATSTAIYAYDSLMSVRWMSNSKKAYYFAQAGVEAASYSYQYAYIKSENTKPAGGTPTDKVSKFIEFSEPDDAIVDVKTVYVKKSYKSADHTRFDRLDFTNVAPTDATINDYVGCFTAQIGNGSDMAKIKDKTGASSTVEVPVKVVKCVATAYGTQGTERTETKYGYFSPSEKICHEVFYDDFGVLYNKSSKPDCYVMATFDADGNLVPQGTPPTEKQFYMMHKTVNYDTDIVNANDGFFGRLKKGLIKIIFKIFYGNSKTFDVYLKSSNANMILDRPPASKVITIPKRTDSFYSFATSKDLFLDDVGLNVIPTRGKYASVGLYGDEIIVDGDITMGVYTIPPSSIPLLGGAVDKNSAIISTLGNRYRLGTVVIGNSSAVPPDRQDPMGLNGVIENGKMVPVNKIYFNGNVYVKVFTQGGNAETYRVFTSGDMAYFNGNITIAGKLNNKDVSAKGIDLLKYFLDAVAADRDGFRYGTAVKKKLAKINELYYGGSQSSYFDAGNVPIRKIQVEYNSKGIVTVDGGAGTVRDIIQPTPVSASTIYWGQPNGSKKPNFR